MDKLIIEKLKKAGLITTIGVNADNYESIDDLINKGVITTSGAKKYIEKLLKEVNLTENIEDTLTTGDEKDTVKDGEKDTVKDGEKDTVKDDEKDTVKDDEKDTVKDDEKLIEVESKETVTTTKK